MFPAYWTQRTLMQIRLRPLFACLQYAQTFFINQIHLLEGNIMTANQMLEMIVEQSVQELEKIENLKELHKHEDKFTFEEFEQLEVAILLEMSNMKEEFYREGFKQGVKFILSMQK